jgi:hypothetical protein
MKREEVEDLVKNTLYYEDPCNWDYFMKFFTGLYDLGYEDGKKADYKPPQNPLGKDVVVPHEHRRNEKTNSPEKTGE